MKLSKRMELESLSEDISVAVRRLYDLDDAAPAVEVVAKRVYDVLADHVEREKWKIEKQF